MMYTVEIRHRSISCSCGFKERYVEWVMAEMMAFTHAKTHKSFKIVDISNCSMVCHFDSIFRDEEKPRIHHEDCFNHPDNNEPPEPIFSNQEVAECSIVFATCDDWVVNQVVPAILDQSVRRRASIYILVILCTRRTILPSKRRSVCFSSIQWKQLRTNNGW